MRATPAIRLLLLAGLMLARLPARAEPASGAYHLRVGDVISIALMDHHEEDVKELIIPPDGKIAFANSGLVQAATLTRGQLERALEDSVKRYYTNPKVSINLIRSPSLFIYVTGEVFKPGAYDYTQGVTVIQAEALAQGLKDDAGQTAFLITHDAAGQPSTQAVNLAALESDPGNNDPVLQPGDSLVFPSAFTTISGRVLGQTGRVPLREAGTVQLLIATAHGADPATADEAHVKVQRANGKVYTINLRDTSPDSPNGRDGVHPATFALQPNDVVVVPRLQKRVQIFGAVAQEGNVYLVPHEQDKLLDVLARVGGAPGGDLSRVVLRRSLGGNEQITLPLNVGEKGNPADNVILQDGDVITVPPKLPVTNASQRNLFYVTSLLGLFAGLRALGL